MNQKQCEGTLMTEEPQITLEKFIDTRFDDLKVYIDMRFESADKHREAAFEANNIRLESMNQFRHDLEKQAATFVTRPEMEAKQSTLNVRTAALESARDSQAGRTKQGSISTALVFSVIAVVGMLCGTSIGLASLLLSAYHLFFQP